MGMNCHLKSEKVVLEQHCNASRGPTTPDLSECASRELGLQCFATADREHACKVILWYYIADS